MNDVTTLDDIDNFFYYGQLDLQQEIKSDLYQGLLQPSRSMFYNRSEAGGVPDYENAPNNLFLQISLRFKIAKYVSWRNLNVGDGTNNTKERRAAVSQFSIIIDDSEASTGYLGLQVLYIPFSDYSQIGSINTGIGIGI